MTQANEEEWESLFLTYWEKMCFRFAFFEGNEKKKRTFFETSLENISPTRSWSPSYQTFIFTVFQFLLLSLKVCSIQKNVCTLPTAKLSNEKRKNYLFTKKQSLVRLPPDVNSNWVGPKKIGRYFFHKMLLPTFLFYFNTEKIWIKWCKEMTF